MSSSEEKSYVAPVMDDHGAIELSEREDEDQIVAMLHGATVDKLYYEIERYDAKKGAMVKTTSLSWAGVKWFTLRLGRITVEEVRLTENEAKYRAIAWARDKARDVRVMGAAEQPKKIETKKGIIDDEFALAKVVSKAQRNALRNLIPETLISEALAAWQKEPKVKDTVAAATAAAKPKSALEIEDQLREFTGSFKVEETQENDMLVVTLTKNFGADEFRDFRQKVEGLGGKYALKGGIRCFEIPK